MPSFISMNPVNIILHGLTDSAHRKSTNIHTHCYMQSIRNTLRDKISCILSYHDYNREQTQHTSVVTNLTDVVNNTSADLVHTNHPHKRCRFTHGLFSHPGVSSSNTFFLLKATLLAK